VAGDGEEDSSAVVLTRRWRRPWVRNRSPGRRGLYVHGAPQRTASIPSASLIVAILVPGSHVRGGCWGCRGAAGCSGSASCRQPARGFQGRRTVLPHCTEQTRVEITLPACWFGPVSQGRVLSPDLVPVCACIMSLPEAHPNEPQVLGDCRVCIWNGKWK